MTTIQTKSAGEPDGSIGRLNALTDGVVAIAITLLALDFKPTLPDGVSSGELAHYLREHAADYRAFVIAFFLIAQYWVVHRQRMRAVTRSSGALVRVTLLFLFAITVAPATASISGNETNSLAVTLFAANVALIGASAGALGEVIRRQRLDNYDETRHERVLRISRSATGVSIAMLVAALAWVVSGYAAYAYLLFLAAERPGRAAWRIMNSRRQDAF